MNSRILQCFFVLGAFFTCSIVSAQAPVFDYVTPNSNSIARLDKFELDIRVSAAFTNPYDYDDIAVQAIFTAPAGSKDTVDGFYIKTYRVGNNGYADGSYDSLFNVRYTPRETGTYSYVLTCKNLAGTATYPAQTFQSTAADGKGFIRKNTTNYLSFDNGSQYIPMGENMGWQDNSPINDYTNWVSKLSANGGNFIRVWMSSWAFALEWKNVYNGDGFSGLKNYKQTSAFYLDWLLDYCKQNNVYMMLTLNNHGQVSTQTNPEWSNNPYNTANGGPAANTWDFFTNTAAKSTLKNRLRYIVARYGYSQNIQSWELFNEVVWTDQFATHKNEITAWDDEMSTYIKSKDVNKHLVTTSYGGTDVATNSWNLTNIDFTQTHAYINSANIESVLAAADQSFLTQYNKPTLNGEFGITSDETNTKTAVLDPSGVHLHNAIWATTFSGAMGSAMTWWWDSYVEPQNLYSHFKPLSAFVSKINFPGDNYKKAAATSTGGGASDVTVSPGADFVKAPADDFTIDASGSITPDATSLSKYVFGSAYNTDYRNPPTFHVNYPVAGQFKVITSGSMSTSSPKITIYLDGTQLLNMDAVINTTYSINVPAGAHAIKVDNLGVDWAGISNYTFTNIGSPLSTYVLKSANNLKAAGYALYSKYNWQYLKDNGGAAPPAVTGSSVVIPGLQNGTYNVELYSTSDGTMVSQSSIAVTNGSLTIAMPSIAWDMAFTAAELSTLPITLSSFTGQKINDKNHLYINIATSENVKAVYLQRSADVNNFSSLKELTAGWSTIAGKHEFIDASPLDGANYYRLQIIDNDGRKTYSGVVKLVNNHLAKFSVYPNPFKDYILLTIDKGIYFSRILDAQGKTIKNGMITANSDNAEVKLSLSGLSKGVYYLSLTDENGNVAGSQKLIKN